MKKRYGTGNGKDLLHSINWVGLAAGVLMLILPFMGAWWKAIVGEGALEMAFSPFFYKIDIVGASLTSSLVGYFILAAQLTVLIGGGLMIAGSLTANQWWGEKLVRWGAMKVVWMLVMLLVVLVGGALFMNKLLPSLLSGMMGDLSMNLSLPYLVGTGKASILTKDAVRISGSVTAELTSSFWLAAVTAGLGIGTRFYQSKVIEKQERSGEQEKSLGKDKKISGSSKESSNTSED